MASSVVCTLSQFQYQYSSARRKLAFSSPFMTLSSTKQLKCFPTNRLRSRLLRLGDGGARCWFNFGKSGVDAGIYGSQRRDDFSHYDVEQYFDYTGMLAVEGSYDRVEELLKQNIPPVDILLMMAASEGDKVKIEELLRAGAKYDVKDADGKTALDKAESQEIKDLILGLSVHQNV